MSLILTGSRRRLSLPLLRWIDDPIVLVEPQELDDYRAAHPTVDVRAMPENDRGFAYLMNRMVELTLAAGERFFVFTDDDVTGLRTRASIDDKFTTVRGPDARRSLEDAVDLADAGGYAQLAISFAGQSWGASKPMQEPVGAWGVHVTDARAVEVLGGYDETLPIFNDWEMSARLISSGYRCARTNLTTFVHTMKSHDGGAQEIYERADLVADAARRVADRYAWAARVVHVDAHGLDEVRFSWRKLAVPS